MTILTNTIRTVAFALGIMMIGCTTSKSLMKDGLKYESAGMYEDAVKAYQASLSRKMSNIESRTGLKNAGQRVLDDLLDEFNRYSMLGKLKDAVYAFHLAEDFDKQVKKYGVDLHIPDHYYQTYTQLETNYLDDLYEEGVDFLDQEDFDSARKAFDEIMDIDEDYKDVHILQGTAILEPKYRQAQNYMDAGDYRAAYDVYGSIVRRDPGYKDSKERMAVAREMGTFVMAIMPFENTSSSTDIQTKLEAYVMNSLIDLQNPFLKLVDRQHLDDIMAQQDFSLSGVISDASALEVGNLTGAEAILVGQVIDYRREEGRPVKVSRKGYESYEVKVKNEAGEEVKKTRYRPVTYYEYTNRNSVYLSFHVKLLHLETSEVLISEVIERELADEVNWATYSGNVNRLFPARDDKPLTSRSLVNNLRSLFDARTELSSIEQLLNQSYDRIGDSVAGKVDDYLE